MNVIAIGCTHVQGLNHRNAKANLIINQTFTQGKPFIGHAPGRVPLGGRQRAGLAESGRVHLLALYLDLLASRGSLLGLLQSSASGLVL